MHRMNPGALFGLWVVVIPVAFGIGRWTAAPESDAPPEDLGVAIRAALAEGDLLDRLERSTELMQHLDAGNLPEVLAVYDQMLPLLDQWDIRPFVAAWARFDPAEAFDHVLAWRFNIKQKIGAETAIQTWALRDPMAARVALTQAAANHRNLEDDLYYNLLSGWVSAGAEGLEDYLDALPPALRAPATARTIGALVRGRGTEATLLWVDSILREESYGEGLKKAALRSGARSVARGDPERAAAWMLEHVGREYAQDGPRVVAEEWVRSDGRLAMEWVSELPEGSAREQAARGAFARWLTLDPQAAKAWLSSESLTAFHDPMIDAYARRIDARAPEESIGWCDRILNPDRRLGCLKVAATEWYALDAVAAETWLQQSPLSEEARRAVRTPREKGNRAVRGARAQRGDDEEKVADDEL